MNLAKQDLANGPPTKKKWDENELTHSCDLMYKCEASFKAWNNPYLLGNDEIMLVIFQHLPDTNRAEFVSIINERNDSGTFQKLRKSVEIAASEAESVCGSGAQPFFYCLP